MTISVASGKGGTGKTSVAVGFALVADGTVEIVDADVEEPNVPLFLKPRIGETKTITVPIPSVNETKCDLCGRCAEVCEYHAIAVFPGGPLVFPELCHGCGGCTMFCPRGAIHEIDRPIGIIQRGEYHNGNYAGGTLNVGEASATPIIRELVRDPTAYDLRIVDVPPGVSCPAVAGTRLSDYVILVAEPTRFGLADLEMAVEAVRLISRPFGVIINRTNARTADVTAFCRREGIPVLLEIPESRSIAAAYCRGESMVSAEPRLSSDLRRLLEEVSRQIGDSAGGASTGAPASHARVAESSEHRSDSAAADTSTDEHAHDSDALGLLTHQSHASHAEPARHTKPSGLDPKVTRRHA